MIKSVKRIPFVIRIMIVIALLIMTTLLILGLFLNHQYARSIEEQMGLRALSVAQSVSLIPSVILAFDHENPETVIQPIAEQIRKETGAEFIVVGNAEGIRYSHPLQNRLGEKMVGGDNDRALVEGQSYVSKAVGSLGPSIRGKVPIYGADGQIIGLVSVGFLSEELENVIEQQVFVLWAIVVLLIGIGFLGAFLISHQLKKEIHGLEPEEIGRLFEEKEATLQSIHEGVIAVNREGNITMFNQTAKKFMIQDRLQEPLIGKHVTELVTHTRLPEVLRTGKEQLNQELWVGDDLFIVNRVPIFLNKKIVGAVSTFRSRTEILNLSEELSKVKKYTDALRAQTHEFSNKLNTISGLLQLHQVNDAIDYIQKENVFHQQSIHFLIDRIDDPFISAVLLGKLNQAHESGIEMEIEESSSLTTTLTEKQRESFITIIGNLLENAFEALLDTKQKSPHVFVSFTDYGHDLIFEIEDNGLGIPAGCEEAIFEQGYSTKKGKHRGFGLALVKNAVNHMGGSIVIEQGSNGGTCFVVIAPKGELR